jgi:AraC-like DNA-binding protein
MVDTAVMWKPTSIPEVLLLRARYERQHFTRHTHADYVIGVNAGGAHRFDCRGAKHDVPGGCIAFVNPEEVHTGENLGDAVWDYRGFYVNPAWLHERWRELGRGAEPPMFRRSVVIDPQLSTELRGLHRALAACSDPLASTSLAEDVFSRLLCRHADSNIRVSAPQSVHRRNAAVRVAREYLDDCYAAPVTVGELAARAGVGTFQLLRAFTRVVGMPPYEYLTSVRVRHARRLLAAGRTAASVALEVGFCDQSHLIRHFKRVVGVTPGTYSRAVQRMPALSSAPLPPTTGM